jgi:hypothetical protein
VKVEAMPKIRTVVAFIALLVVGLPAADASAVSQCHLGGAGHTPYALANTIPTQIVSFSTENIDCSTVDGLILKVFFDTAQVSVTSASYSNGVTGTCHIARAAGVAKCLVGSLAAGHTAVMTLTVQVIEVHNDYSDPDPLTFRTKDPAGVVGRYVTVLRWQCHSDSPPSCGT